MWRTKKPEGPEAYPFTKEAPAVTPEPSRIEPSERAAGRDEIARVGKSLAVKGEISGQEDLYIDGEVEGTIELADHNLTIGPHGRVHADIHAREIVILGKVQGNMRASERIDIRKSGAVTGDLLTARIVIEDGAFFKGGIDIQKPEEKEKARAAAAAADFRIAPAPISLETKNKLQ